VTDVYYPTLADVAVLARKIGAPIRDLGLIESALARPQTSVFGDDAYPDLFTKAAALLQSLVANHAFVDGNKRMGWVVTVTFLAVNGAVTSFDVDQDQAYRLVISVADGSLRDVSATATELRALFVR
jgi:death on curing protein